MNIKNFILPTLLMIFLIGFINPEKRFIPDIEAFFRWKGSIQEMGLGNIYDIGVNYPPLYLYILKIQSFLAGYNETFEHFALFIKFYTLAFECACVLFLVSISSNDSTRLKHWSLLILNISFLYNTIIWGQVDGIAAALNFACIYAAYRKRWTLAGFFFVLSVNFKIQGIIFLPLLILMLIPEFNKITLKKKFSIAIVVLSTQTLILMPWIYLGKLNLVYDMAVNSVGYYPVVNCNAANIWWWLFPYGTDLVQTNDQNTWLSISLKAWGLIMFMITCLIAVVPYLKKIYNYFFKNIEFELHLNHVLMLGGLLPISLFFFSTQMHERYSHNAWFFIAAWSFINKKYFPLILFSLAYFLNMESVLKAFHTSESIIWNFRFIAIIFGILIGYLVQKLITPNRQEMRNPDYF